MGLKLTSMQKSRAERRREAHMNEADSRHRMRGLYRAIARLAIDTRDTFIARRLLTFEPYVRAMKPKSEGIKAARIELDNWADGLEIDVRQALADAAKNDGENSKCETPEDVWDRLEKLSKEVEK